jgi:DNA/RNA-binding domain of Phe-tRNA-synthetase-like protein
MRYGSSLTQCFRNVILLSSIVFVKNVAYFLIKMTLSITFSKSSKYVSRYPEVAFGLTLISGCRNFLNPTGFDQYKRKLLRRMRKREILAEITKRIDIYEKFFNDFGYECPLPKHLKRTVNSGFPRYNLMVDVHFMSEMCAGILVAVTDYDRFDGPLTLDLAEEGELCRAMGQRDFTTNEGEVVLRDEKEVVCVLCQGADDKTRVTEDTSNVLFYAYAVPGINESCLKDGLNIAAETMAEFGKGVIEGVKIF